MCRRKFRRSLYRLGPLAAAALLFALVGAPGALAGSGPNVIANPGFETGNFWAWGGGGSYGAYADVTPLVSHSGRDSAVIGYPYRPANLSSFISQVVAVPLDHPTLTFFIRPQCTPTATDDESFRLLIRDMATGLFVREPVHVCTTSLSWIRETVDMSPFAGRVVQLVFNEWSRGTGPVAAYTLLDDVSLS